MAINPNTDFTAGAIFTAAQANRFPRGIMALTVATSNFTMSTSEAVSITASTFTAVANRYYKVTYYEPGLSNIAGAGNDIQARIRLTNTSGTQFGYGLIEMSGATAAVNSLNVVVITTFTAGSIVVVGTLQSNTGAPLAIRSATIPGLISVEDIGPA
jgi:hypothetical protein